MPGKSPKKADAKASGKSKDKPARDGKPARGPGVSPFAGRSIHVAFGADDAPSAPLRCLAHDGNFLLVEGESGEVWINLDHVAKVVVVGAVPAADPIADAVAAFKANPGPLEDTGA